MNKEETALLEEAEKAEKEKPGRKTKGCQEEKGDADKDKEKR